MSELPKGWVRTAIKEIVDFNPRHDPETQRDLEISFVPMPAVDEHLGAITTPQKRLLSEVWKGFTHFVEGDVIFAKITPCMENGKTAVAHGLINGLACGSTEFHVLRPTKAVLAEFIWRYLRQKSFRAEAEAAMTGAVGQRRVPKGFLEERELSVPPLPEQRRIAAKLDRLSEHSSAARDHLSRVTTLATRAKQAILRAAYQGHLTRKWRGAQLEAETVRELLARVPEPEQSRGGRKATTEIIEGVGGVSVNAPETEVPEGWEWVSLRRIARQETGHTPSRKHPEWWGGEVPWIGIKDANLHHGREIQNTLQTTNDDGLANSSARLLPTGTVCLSRTASVGYVTMMGRPMATSQDFATWTCSEALNPKFLMYALMSEGDDIRRFGEGTTHTTIYFPEIRAFHIKLAPIEEQRLIVRMIEKAFDHIESFVEEASRASHLLDRLDERLLAKAFQGELVPQDPDDEPAEALLERIREARAAAPKPKRARRKKTA